MWYGEYIHKLDKKDRFVLPAKFRGKIKAFESKIFYLTRGLEGCLFLFSQDVWQTLEEKLKNDRNLSPVERKSTEEKLSNEARDMRRIKEDLDAEFQKIDREVTQQTMREIAEVVKKLADKDGWTLILEKSAGGVVFSKDVIDITQKVLSEYDEKGKK